MLAKAFIAISCAAIILVLLLVWLSPMLIITLKQLLFASLFCFVLGLGCGVWLAYKILRRSGAAAAQTMN